ncbi:DUF6544 family protein [Leptolinea tardivitalis]|uniref:Uncharacterized protein n=1 Tax=Leptolinea tardivitalis TaxID=229920 RepID=A0A0P6XN96_9CHLR|nr:DUF6544 family protein [Leptolinea tardivitalis]KPL70430.1 hypothetical protein ADM99_14905 [Leptolinea tardivitalis]GAP22011.1 hypothetical protein LTAR_02229 [Leptolinea tardivitalis]
MTILMIVLLALAIFALILWVGLQVSPRPFADYHGKPAEIKTIPLPEGLPQPVERYYRVVYGDEIPVITSAVLTGHATLRPFGPVFLPARFRFTHLAGKDYRHYIEVTFFNIPILKVNERYLDKKARMELPFATDEGDKLDQAANLGLWAETAWFPSVFLTTPGVNWLPADDNTALLVVPFNESTDQFIVRFDPETGFAMWFEAMRYHDSKSTEKVLWLNHVIDLKKDGLKLSFKTGSAIWMDDGKPWAYFTVDNINLNVDVSEYIRQKGI